MGIFFYVSLRPRPCVHPVPESGLSQPRMVQSVLPYDRARLVVLPALTTHQWCSLLLGKERKSFLGARGGMWSGPASPMNLSLPPHIPFVAINMVVSLFLFTKIFSHHWTTVSMVLSTLNLPPNSPLLMRSPVSHLKYEFLRGVPFPPPPLP